MENTKTLNLSRMTPQGQINLIIGPMFSGKTTELFKRLDNQYFAKKKILLVKYSFDTRYSDQINLAATHSKMTRKGVSCQKIEEIKDKYKQYDVIGIDEGQFFPDVGFILNCFRSIFHSFSINRYTTIRQIPSQSIYIFLYKAQQFQRYAHHLNQIVQMADLMAGEGKKVIISALNGTFQRKQFGRILELVPLAENIIKLKSVCKVCFQSADFTQRIIDSSEIEVIGGSQSYIPVCRKCFNEGPNTNMLKIKHNQMMQRQELKNEGCVYDPNEGNDMQHSNQDQSTSSSDD